MNFNQSDVGAIDSAGSDTRLCDHFLSIWNSNQTADSKKRQIQNFLMNLDRDEILLLGKQLYELDSQLIHSLHNLIIGKFPEMRNEEHIMLRIYDHIKGHQTRTDEFKHPCLKPIKNSTLLEEGFNYYACFENQNIVEQFLDWLEDKKYKFMVNEQGHFNIECIDRDTAYRVGRKISELMNTFQNGHPFMRDESKEFNLKNKKSDKFMRDEQVEINNLVETPKKNRITNPAAKALQQGQFKSKMTKTKRDKEKQQQGRKAKHKNKPELDEHVFHFGEKLFFNNQLAEVSIPKGPLGTVGILVDHQLMMVESKELRKLDEGVLGFTPMPTISRLKELAGLETRPLYVDEAIVDDVIDIGKRMRALQKGKTQIDPLYAKCFTGNVMTFFRFENKETMDEWFKKLSTVSIATQSIVNSTEIFIPNEKEKEIIDQNTEIITSGNVNQFRFDSPFIFVDDNHSLGEKINEKASEVLYASEPYADDLIYYRFQNRLAFQIFARKNPYIRRVLDLDNEQKKIIDGHTTLISVDTAERSPKGKLVSDFKFRDINHELSEGFIANEPVEKTPIEKERWKSKEKSSSSSEIVYAWQSEGGRNFRFVRFENEEALMEFVKRTPTTYQIIHTVRLSANKKRIIDQQTALISVEKAKTLPLGSSWLIDDPLYYFSDQQHLIVEK